ncbi:hypothetical protein D1007_13917 [Hordeum vulgare]|nr:hypothetical protein D1007_13917 [Hordeum vulgare]
MGALRPPPYPDVTLPLKWHLDLEKIPVPAVPRSMRAHAEEVRRRRKQLTPEQRGKPVYIADSPNWEAWFAWEHEEQQRRGICNVVAGSPLPLVLREEDQEAEAAYQNVLADVLHASEEEAPQGGGGGGLPEQTGGGHCALHYRQLCLAAAGLTIPAEPGLMVLRPELYVWDGVVCEWVSASSVWLGAMPEHEAAYLEHSWHRRV